MVKLAGWLPVAQVGPDMAQAAQEVCAVAQDTIASQGWILAGDIEVVCFENITAEEWVAQGLPVEAWTPTAQLWGWKAECVPMPEEALPA